MSNFTTFLESSSNDWINNSSFIPTIDELLDHLGFEMWETVLNIFILPPINLIGFTCCTFSLWIFSISSFEDPIFFYYRLLCFANMIHLLHNIPSFVLFSPRYFPMIDTYYTCAYKIYYTTISFFLFNFEDVIQMGILLQKMKLFSPFVRRYFTASPQIVSLAFFFTCLLIGIPLAFSVKISAVGNYVYFKSSGVKHISTLYFNFSSDFSQTLLGKIVLGFTSFFLSQFLSLLTGIILNVFSYIKFKSYLSKKQKENEELQLSSINNRPTTRREIEQQRDRERKERQIERNMFYMALNLCSISTLSRVIIMIGYVIFFFNFSFSSSLLGTIVSIIFTIVPSISIFVFYSFNAMFRQKMNEILGIRSIR